jgi:hypothetical protein
VARTGHTRLMSEPTVPAAPRRRTGLIAAIAIGLVVLVAGGVTAWYLTRPGSFTVRGSITLAAAGTSCSGTAFRDISQGVQVKVTAENGTILGVGGLQPGAACVWDFTIPGVPAGHHWYGVTIAQRGTVQFTEAQMRAGPQLGLH